LSTSNLFFPKPKVAMQQTNMILMEENDHEWCARVSQKNIKVTNRVIRDKIISQKLIHHTQGIVEWKTWKTFQSRNKCLSIQNKIHLWMKIVDKRGEVNLSQWMKMVKGRNGLNYWGHRNDRGQCMHCSKHTIQTYSLTWTNVHAQCNCADGGGVRSNAIFEDL